MRQLLEIVCLNLKLDGVSLCYEMRKPFDVLAKGLLVSSSRVDKTAIELFLVGVQGWEAGLRRRFGGSLCRARGVVSGGVVVLQRVAGGELVQLGDEVGATREETRDDLFVDELDELVRDS